MRGRAKELVCRLLAGGLSVALCVGLTPTAWAGAGEAEAAVEAEAATGGAAGASEATALDDEFLVTYRNSAVGRRAADGSAVAALDSVCDVEAVEDVAAAAEAGQVQKIELEEGADLQEAMAAVEAQPGVESVQRNFSYQLLGDDADAPDATDPLTSKQTYLDPWDATFQGTCGANVRAAWEQVGEGSHVTVAVLDTGVDATHQDLRANLDLEHAYYVGTRTTGENAVVDTNGHGTHVCGIAAGVSSNGVGISGASNNVATVLPIKVIVGNEITTENLVKAYSYLSGLVDAGKLTDLRVINVSIGGLAEMNADGTPALERTDLLLEQAISQMRQKNVLTVCAGGNGVKSVAQTGFMMPADFDACLSVTALKADGANATYSDYNKWKDISAPGSSILSTLSSKRSSGTASSTDAAGAYGYMNGTSMASPLVAAIAALLWAKNPQLSVDQVVESLTSTAHAVNTASNDRTGSTGSAGAVDAAAALAYAQRFEPAGGEDPGDDPAEPGPGSGESDDPAGSDDPSDPSGSDDPASPSDPSDPADPEGPTDPADPSDPTDPADPEGPTDPSGPAAIGGKVGARFTAGSSTTRGIYQVTSNNRSTAKLVQSKVTGTRATVPSRIVLNGKSYKVTAISGRAFANKKRLKSVSLGAYVQSIGARAFSGCVRLGGITLATRVSVLGKRAFEGCKKLSVVTVKTKKLTKAGVRGSLSGSKVRTVRVRLGSASANRAYVKRYARCFAKSNSGRSVTVR